MTNGGYDLHTHSVFSDGTMRPAEIARAVGEAGLAGFALTDHDTIDGWGEARDAAADAGVDFVPGIEITTKYAGRSRHLLGYGVDPAAGELFDALARVRDARVTRAREMVRRLSRDFSITWESVVGAGDAITVGRPHIADALVDAGYAVDRSTAFTEILHPGSAYYLGTEALETTEAIALVRAAGGRAALAHPAAFRQRAGLPVEHLAELAEAGLWGVEFDHPENREDWLVPLRLANRDLGLEVTGASDFHGAGKPNRLGDRVSSPELVARLRGAGLATPR